MRAGEDLRRLKMFYENKSVMRCNWSDYVMKFVNIFLIIISPLSLTHLIETWQLLWKSAINWFLQTCTSQISHVNGKFFHLFYYYTPVVKMASKCCGWEITSMVYKLQFALLNPQVLLTAIHYLWQKCRNCALLIQFTF